MALHPGTGRDVIAGTYTLHLYCDNLGNFPDGTHEFREFPWEYTDEYGSNCRSRARQAGWRIDWKKGIALCPKCNPSSPRFKKDT